VLETQDLKGKRNEKLLNEHRKKGIPFAKAG
jgi:hypothetical protein